MTSAPHAEHEEEVLCTAGAVLYERAIHGRSLTSREIEQAPCLVRLGLLQPAVADPDAWEPLAPRLGLHRLLRASADRIAHERREEERLVSAFAPLLLAGGHDDIQATPTLTLHTSFKRIGHVIEETMAHASEVLAIQPRSRTTQVNPAFDEPALQRDQALLDRGGRIRALYQHTLRHAPKITARYERLRGDVEARTLDEVTARLLVFDRTVAFIPARADRATALEIRHPAIVTFLATAFDRLWRLATPMYPQAVQPPSPDRITPRQRAIAELLIEGHTDTTIADRLGMNVRTARVHIAKLAATLGSQSRAQLGYLIGQSGILDQQEPET
ncbi:helix-turn-helix transcriptional regulator [Streptomyces sp. 15-116A]|uniref:helix-turn-helix transcriptional regulator n=1 Tax=Streptomyces sp. 15-116A TaxID=2259035 RepID=UPI0021B1AA50|nr:helix-turn-helix transcriptional regulator [Streptomyces sp. 15-116A]MCT7354856.1 helix-turn-helix transcriptional regulator [Streptomyces sp. 15-116A]